MSRTLFDPDPAGRAATRPNAHPPRPYQEAAVYGGGGHPGVVPTLAEHGRCLVEMATGLGKTTVMGMAADHHLTTADTGVVLLAHREELVFQAAAELEPLIGFRPEVEMGESVADPRSRCVVASVQTLFNPRRLARFDPQRFGLLMVDEAHHCVRRNKTYARPLDHFAGSHLLGVTATARRANEKSGRPIALGPVFGSVAYSMGIREAVEQSWLVPVRQHTVRSTLIDLSEVGSAAGDLDRADLSRAMTADERVVWEIAGAVVDHCGDQPTLVFSCPRPPGEPEGQGQKLADRLNRVRPGSAVFLSGETPPDDRRRQLRRFEAGEFPYLVGCSLFTEGFNVPSIANVVMARPTKSVVYYCLDSQTELLTDKGWVGLADWDHLDDGRRAAGYDLNTGEAVWTEITAKYRRPLSEGEKMYALRSPQTDIRVTQAHRLLFRPATGRRASDLFRLMPAEELAARRAEYEIPASAVQNAPGVPLTDDELRFVGWVMTDGTINKKTGQVLIRQAAHQPWVPALRGCIEGCGFKYGYREFARTTPFKKDARAAEFSISKGRPRGRDKDKRGWGALEAFISKDLAPALEDMTADQLAVLLEAMHLGDGAKQSGQPWTRRSYHIYTANKVMADRLQSLCVRRGFRCSLADHTGDRPKPFYCLHVKREQARHVGGRGYTDRPVLGECPTTPGEVVWCVTTGTSTIITRRNGKVTVMGQTQAIGRGTRTLRGVLRPDLNGDPAGRAAAILASAKPHLTVYDFAGNAGCHKLVTAADIFAGDAGGEAVDRVKKRAEGGPADVLELFREDAREQAAARERRAVVRVDTRTEEVCPFAHSDAGGGRAAAKRTPTDPATPDQLAYVERRGGLVRAGMTAGEAGREIADIERRWKAHLCSRKQQRTLARLGLPDREWPKAHAKALLDWAEATGWPWERMRLPYRSELALRAADGGWRLTVRGHPAGPVFATPHDVRRAYEGLALDADRGH